ncbi:hypothetical protein EJV47_05035 [Hymenobacter gummosus]|uniref:Peptidase S13 n=1 Tax=Hymenobacter gummosus TaxID=1776032 RepID=A0A431U7Z4_9BACT|nr:D-alanyl-D-alanine carboxypeptidase [Hymenobacter gummosus]RTQ52381.1 hypothetical protein EJV47_05035 [Hymenobacter gummosus]
MLLRFSLLLLLTAWSLSWPPSCSRQSHPSPTVPPPVTAATPLPWLDSLLTSAPGLRRHAVGLSLAYADSTRPFYDYHAAQYFKPASTLKLLSFYAALHLLPDTLPSLRYFSRHDTLYFQGTGDPTFLHPDVPSRRAYAFLAARPERVLAYCELPTAPAYGPGWAWDDYRYYFQPERGAFPLYGNTVRFYYVPAVPARRRPGRPARLQVRPRAFAPLTSLAPAPAPGPPQGHVQRALLSNSFVALPAPRRWVDEVPYRTSRALLCRLLGDTLRRRVVAAAWRPHPTRGDAIRTLPGLPADTLYRRMLRVSDNFLAEQLLLMCATRVGYRDSLSTGRVIREARRTSLAFLPDAPVWVDGSGLSPLNLLTPRDLTALLGRLHQEVPEHRLLSLLASGGGSGTLRRRYASAGGPWIWAKTGTLRHDLNLCGYLRTRSGRLVAFAFMNNNHPTSSWAVRNEVERVLGQVRRRL